jgi:transcriptional regulator with XRE-family HTH domain
MIGEKIRGVRQSQGRSLAEVAGKAKISVATLSRIETDKQSIDVDLLIVLAGVLGIEASDLLGQSQSGDEGLAQRIAGLDATKRAELWRQMTSERRTMRSNQRNPASSRNMTEQVEELVAQLDFVREELDAVRARVKKQR